MKKIKVFNPNNLPVISYKKLEPLQGNLKQVSKKAIEKIINSIIENGIFVPKFVWIDDDIFYIVDGHTTQMALIEIEKQGYTIPDIPYAIIDALNKTDAKRKLLLINSRYGKIHGQGLYEFLETSDIIIDDLISQIDLPEIDFNKFKNEFYLEETNNDDDIPENIKAITKNGDLWELGRHRLLCGDSTIKENVDKLTGGNKIDMVFTSPPYNMGDFGFDNFDKSVYSGRSDNIKNYDKFLINFIDISFLYSNFVFLNIGLNRNNLIDVITVFNNFKELICDIMIWHKNQTMPISKKTKNRLNNDFEFIIILDKNKSKKSRKVYINKEFYNVSNIFNLDRNRGNEYAKICKATFNIEFVNYILSIFISSNTSILDSFLGIGSTLIACEKTDRICYGMEIDLYYCDVIVRRYIQWCADNNRECIIKLNGKVFNG